MLTFKYIGEDKSRMEIMGDKAHNCNVYTIEHGILLTVKDLYWGSSYFCAYETLTDLLKDWEEVSPL